MASILLSHVASDNAAAKQLLAVLEGAGHKVVGADPDGPPFQNADLVVVIWSPASLTSPYVYEQARVALSSRSLVQVTTAGLGIDQLPAVFRVHGAVSTIEGERLLEEVDRALRSKPRGGFGGIEMASFKSAHREEQSSEPSEVEEPAAAPEERAPTVRNMRRRRSTDAVPPVSEEPSASAEALGDQILAALADRPPSPAPIPSDLSRRAIEKEAGQLNHKIPSTMRVGATEVVEVRLGRAHQDIAIGLLGSGNLTSEELPIIETMTVDLYGSPDAFRIVRQSRATQLVNSSLIWNTPFDDQRFGRWLWHVTPKKSGTHKLVVKVSADMSDSRGVATTEPYGDRTFSVKVRVNLGQASVRVLKWTTAGAVSGLAGAYTHEVWWPKLRALLAAAGLLS